MVFNQFRMLSIKNGALGKISSIVASGILWNLGLYWKVKMNISLHIGYNKFTGYKLLANNSKKYVKNVDKTCKIKNLIVE